MEKSNINKDDSKCRELMQEKNLPELLSVHELASYLHKSTRWIQMENSAGRLPKSLMMGRSRFWIAEDVEVWLKSKIGEGVIKLKSK